MPNFIFYQDLSFGVTTFVSLIKYIGDVAWVIHSGTKCSYHHYMQTVALLNVSHAASYTEINMLVIYTNFHRDQVTIDDVSVCRQARLHSHKCTLDKHWETYGEVTSDCALDDYCGQNTNDLVICKCERGDTKD